MANYTLPNLPYDYNALEPYIDEQTMKLHHTKHHQAYLDKFIGAIKETPLEQEEIMSLFSKVSTLSPAIRNNGGGYWNHSFFWESMTPNFEEPSEIILNKIKESFGSFEEFKTEFSNAAATRFGSGWAWLGEKEDGSLEIYSTPNQDNCFMDVVEQTSKPLLALDVWEHAYYLNYQNKRPEYIDAFFKIINWKKVEERINN